MNPWNIYLRWRHSRGYGVHSPFAYRFVTDVLQPGNYGYYAYHIADNMAASPKYDAWRYRKEIYFLIRLFIFLGVGRVMVSGLKSAALEIAAKSVGIPCVTTKLNLHPKDLLVVTSQCRGDENPYSSKRGIGDQIDCIGKAIKANVPIFSFSPDDKTREIMEKPQECGVLFNSPKRILLIPRPQMEYVSYTLNL